MATNAMTAPVTEARERDREAATPKRRANGITLQQLRIFVAVASAETLTRAGKELGLAQPSISQQIARLEESVGTKLFERRSTRMELTEAGLYLVHEAEPLLIRMTELEDGLAAFTSGRRRVVKIAGINSVLRQVLPQAMQEVRDEFPEVDFDLQEKGPSEVLDLLYGRRVNIGLVSTTSIADTLMSFAQVPLLDDPYVLAVPAWVDLAAADDFDQLPEPARELLNRSIQFVFGTQRSARVESWFTQMFPEHRVAAQCRTFEVAMGMVEAGVGVCLTPALSALAGGATEGKIRLYRIAAKPRRLVALVPSQIRRVEPYASILDRLAEAGAQCELPRMLPTPPLLARTVSAEL